MKLFKHDVMRCPYQREAKKAVSVGVVESTLSDHVGLSVHEARESTRQLSARWHQAKALPGAAIDTVYRYHRRDVVAAAACCSKIPERADADDVARKKHANCLSAEFSIESSRQVFSLFFS